MLAEQIRTTTVSVWAKLAAARVLLGDRESAAAALKNLDGAKTADTAASLLLQAWVREQIKSDEAAKAARSHLCVDAENDQHRLGSIPADALGRARCLDQGH